MSIKLLGQQKQSQFFQETPPPLKQLSIVNSHSRSYSKNSLSPSICTISSFNLKSPELQSPPSKQLRMNRSYRPSSLQIPQEIEKSKSNMNSQVKFPLMSSPQSKPSLVYLSSPQSQSTTSLHIPMKEPSSPSRYSQTYLDLFSQKASLIDLSVSKQFSYFDHANQKKIDSATFYNATALTSATITPNNGASLKQSLLSSGRLPDSLQLQSLSENQAQTYQLSSHNFYYFGIFMRSKPSPLKLSVKIKSPGEGLQYRLKGFISRTANRPNTFNSDQEFDGRSLKMYADGGKKVFNFDNLYFSLYPEVDMSVKITISFGEDKSASEAYMLFKKQKQIDETTAQAQKEELQNKLRALEQQNPKQIQLFFSHKNKQRQRNITFANKHQFENIFEKFDRMQQNKEEYEAKQMEVVERKNQLFLEKWNSVEEKNRASSLRSQYQIQKRKLVERISKYQLWQLVWAKFIKQVITIDAIHRKFTFIKQQRKIYHRAKFIVIRAVSDWMKTLRKFGPYPEKRVLTQTCITMNKLSQLLAQKCTLKAEGIMCSYMKQGSKISDLKTRIIMMITRVVKIQRQWREVKMKKKKFKELIIRQFQSKYNEILQELKNEIRRQRDPFYQYKSSQQPIVPAKVSDYILLSQLITTFMKQHLRTYYSQYEMFRKTARIGTLGMSEEAKKNHNITIALQKPTFFRLPKYHELRSMVKEYAETKQLLNTN